jgi:hypothetical protein
MKAHWLVMALWLTGCSQVADPEPEPPVVTAPTEAQMDSLITTTDHQILLATAAGAGSGPECNAAIRTYALAVAAYSAALVAVRLAPTALNIALAALAALVVVNETANVRNHCSPPPAPA